MSKTSLKIVGCIALMLQCCAKQTKPVATPSPPTPVEEEVSVPLPDPPEVIAERDLQREYYLGKAKYMVERASNANLKNWLELKLLSIDLAERRASELRNKDDRTSLENREFAQVLAALEEDYKEIDSKINRVYQQYRIDFINSDEVDLDGQPTEDLLAINSEISSACQGRREIHVIGWGCTLGDEEVTKKVSDARAENVASWIVTKGKCRHRVSRTGLGVYSKDEPGLESDVLEALRSKHRIAEILIARETQLDPLPTGQADTRLKGTWDASERTYVNTALGFRISLPTKNEGWYMVPEPEGFPGVSVVLSGRGAQIQVLVSQLSSRPENEVDLLELIGKRLRDLKKARVENYKEIKAVHVKRQMLGDYYELQYQGLVGSGQMRFGERLFLHRGEMITVIAVATPERWRVDELSILEALNSLTLE